MKESNKRILYVEDQLDEYSLVAEILSDYEVIAACNRLDVPVLLDCSYMNVATGIQFDVDQPSIAAITSSLSKTFYGLSPLRIRCAFKKGVQRRFGRSLQYSGLGQST